MNGSPADADIEAIWRLQYISKTGEDSRGLEGTLGDK